jgi:manganese-dependent ADP-ribose/CDP-alcohol diphosphatase
VTAAAFKLLDEKNSNSDKSRPDGLVGVDRRFVKFNCACNWQGTAVLAQRCPPECIGARAECYPLQPSPDGSCASSPTALVWNYDGVMSVVRHSNCVKVCFDHKGGYSIDSHGVHYRTLEAALECPS